MAEAKRAKKTEEVPDELPSLAEDILQEGAKESSSSPIKGDEIPEELPPLDADLSIDASPADKRKPASDPGGEESDESYFGNLMDRLKRHPRVPQDFLSEMKTFWTGHGGEVEKGKTDDIKTSFELELEHELQQKVDQLKELEANWKQQKLDLERSKRQVESTEIEITLRSEELKKILATVNELREVYQDIKEKIDARNVRLEEDFEQRRAVRLADHRKRAEHEEALRLRQQAHQASSHSSSGSRALSRKSKARR